MALNLIRSGAALTVMSASGRHHDEFAALGARTVSNAAALGGAAIVFLCLPDGDTVRRVALGDAGLHTALKPGSLVVDTSTTAPHVAIEIAAALARAGIGFVDAPVSGMESRAVDATLTAMCGASDHHFGVVEPWLRRMASTVLHMGPVGSGQLAEVLPMAVKLGVDPEKIGTVINSGTGRSHASEFFVPRMLRGHFGDGYPMRKAYKDLVTGAELGAREAIPMPVLAAATSTYQTALAQGFGELDKGAMIRVFETLLDVRFHSATHGTPTPKDIPP
jgi:3-hydroxyisobutyrate dehydrogenase-like beta-hydroxyacid dehydrogenase